MPDRVRKRQPIAPFTMDELAVAFALLIPRDRAERLASKWFDTFADENRLDGRGRYLYMDWRDEASLGGHEGTYGSPVFTQVEGATRTNPYAWLVGESAEELEDILSSFSDLTLDLVALSSPDLRHRVEQAREGEPADMTERRCKELKSVLNERGQH